jgi:4-amino-4-deoxy-L-arabinose transferase-like glycosyltransferase
MELGTGVFLGLVVLATVWLYISTRERWRWKRIAVWAGVFVVAPVVSLGAWIGITKYIETRPEVQSELWDLAVRMNPDEVLFRKGEPSHRTADFWVYEDAGRHAYVVYFRQDKVRAIVAYTKSDSGHLLPTLQGIGSWSDQGDVTAKFGAPTLVSVSKDKSKRMLNFARYGVVFQLERNAVSASGVFDPETGPLKFADVDKPES